MRNLRASWICSFMLALSLSGCDGFSSIPETASPPEDASNTRSRPDPVRPDAGDAGQIVTAVPPSASQCALVPPRDVTPVKILENNQEFTVITTRRVERITGAFDGGGGPVNSVVFSPDGRCALSGTNDSALRLWDMATGGILRLFRGHEGPVNSVAFDPEGRYALSGSADATLRLWDVATGDVLRLFRGHEGPVNSVTFDPEGRYALSGSADATLRLWDVATGDILRLFGGHEGPVNSVAFDPEGRYALSGSADATLRLWDVATGDVLRLFRGHEGPVNSVAFSPDGRHALSGSTDGTLQLWDVTTGNALRRMFAPNHSFTLTVNGVNQNIARIATVAFSPNGQYAISGAYNNTLRLWNVATGDTYILHGNDAILYGKYNPFDEMLNSIAFSPDGRNTLSGSEDGSLRIGAIRTRAAKTILDESVAASAEDRFLTLLEDKVGPRIPEPPFVEVNKDPFEKRVTFEQRTAAICTARRELYQEQVNARNAKLQAFEADREHWELRALAESFASTYGNPELHALVGADNAPKYDSEHDLMYARLGYEWLDGGEEVSFEVPAGEAARFVYLALTQGKAKLAATYRCQRDAGLVLLDVEVKIGDQRYHATPVRRREVVDSRKIHAVGFGCSFRENLRPQNPNLKDATCREYLSHE